MSRSRLAQQVQFLLEVDRLKEVLRQTLLTQSRRRENDAEHSWHLALAVVVLAEHVPGEPLDVLRVLKMVLIHDLVEIDAGDTFAYDTQRQRDQYARESLAADRIFALLPDDQAKEFRALWEEFETRGTPEARFAVACDRFLPVLLNCATDGAAWRTNGVTHGRVLDRNRVIGDAAPALWEIACEHIAAAVRSGHLPE